MKLQNLGRAIDLQYDLIRYREDLEKFEKTPKKSVTISAPDGTGMNNYFAVVVDSDELYEEVRSAIKNRIAYIERSLRDLGVEL